MDLRDLDTLLGNLCFAHRMMVASAPLLEFAIPKSEGKLRAYYEKHLEEERGHDLMVKRDLKALGVEDVPQSHRAAQIAGSQYYLIAHDHPALLLGYMHALERESLPLAEVDALSAHHGVQLTALRHHCEHDPQHKLDLEKAIDALPDSLRERVHWNERCVIRFLEESHGY